MNRHDTRFKCYEQNGAKSETCQTEVTAMSTCIRPAVAREHCKQCYDESMIWRASMQVPPSIFCALHLPALQALCYHARHGVVRYSGLGSKVATRTIAAHKNPTPECV